jgi:hypothetical protein
MTIMYNRFGIWTSRQRNSEFQLVLPQIGAFSVKLKPDTFGF